jgi:KDO2-lipid IV(A) lauroyltransferase
MKKLLGSISFFLVYPIFWIISNLPFPLLYGLSDFISFLAYRVFGYRKKVVRANLLAAFPEKTDEERLQIEKRFYKHLVDTLLEPFILLNCSKAKINKHANYKSIEQLNNYYKEGKNVIVTTGHYGNWEWPGSVAADILHKVLAIYKPLSNPRFEQLFYKLRSRFSGIPVPMADTLRFVNQYITNKTPFVIYMISDQRPLKQHAKSWLTFMNQETPILPGPGKIGRKYNMPIVYIHTRKIKRGYYEFENILITDNPKEMSDNEIMIKYFSLLEKNIRENPELYLWSHNRWRFKSEEVAKDFPITFIDKV